MTLASLIKQAKENRGHVNLTTEDLEYLENQQAAEVEAASGDAWSSLHNNVIEVYAAGPGVDESPTAWANQNPDLPVELPIFKIAYGEDAGDPSVGIPGAAYWYLAPNQKGTFLELPSFRTKFLALLKDYA